MNAHDSNCWKCDKSCSGCPGGLYHFFEELPPEFECPLFERKKPMEYYAQKHRAEKDLIRAAIAKFKGE